MPCKIKVTYFNSKGRAEVIRLLLAAAEVEYEDERITPEQWKDLKAKTPFGRLPVLSVDGRIFGESGPILRFLAKEHKFLGKNATEACLIDGLFEYMKEIGEKPIPILRDKTYDEETKKEKLEACVQDDMKPMLKRLEKKLEENKGGDGYFVGDKMSMCDIQMFHISEMAQSIPVVDRAMDDCPKLTALCQRVSECPGVTAWLKKRPQTAN